MGALRGTTAGPWIRQEVKRGLASRAALGVPLAVLLGATAASGQTEVEEPRPAAAVTDEIVVFGLRIPLQEARERRREADNLKEIVAANEVGKLPDANIAEALNRVSSVYLLPNRGEGRYVSIRGVDPILNNVTLNSQPVAVSDTDGRSGRAAPLDVLSASAVSFIEVVKVTTPDMDGQSVGGTINLITPSGFDTAVLSVQLEAGDNDFNGQSGGIFAVDGNYADQFGGRTALYLGANLLTRDYLTHFYENPQIAVAENAFADTLFPDRVRFGSAVGERQRSSFSANLQHKPGDESMMWLRGFYTEFVDEELRPEFTIRNRGDLGATSPTDFFWTRYRIENETREERQERPVDQLVLGGQLQVSGAWSLDGALNFTSAEELNPYLNYYESETQSSGGSLDDPASAPVRFVLDGDSFATPTYDPAASGGLTPADPRFHQVSRLRNVTSQVLEDTVTADGNARWSGEWGERSVRVKAGLRYIDRQKSVDDQDVRYPYRGSDTLGDAALGALFRDVGQGVPYTMVSGQTLPVPSPTGYQTHRASNLEDYELDVEGSAANSVEDDYDLSEQIVAAYVMATVDLSPELSVTFGARFEDTAVDVTAFSFVDRVETDLPPEVSRVSELPFVTSDIVDVSDSHSYTNVLPAVLAKWAIDDRWQLRASVSTNLGRPDYPDTAPISTLTVFEDFLQPGSFSAFNEIGNPDLEPYEAVNYDLSLDHYFRANPGVFSVGGFYKRIDNAIYEFRGELEDFVFATVLFDTYTFTSLNNAEPGHVAGVELAYQQDYVKLPGSWNGFGFLANIAFIDSEVEVFQRPGEKLPFFNQADLLYNAQLYWERSGFFARVAVAHQGESIFDELASDPADDLVRTESTRIDAQLSYEISDRYRVFLSGRNLTDEPDLIVRRGSQHFVADSPGFEIYGREYRLGLTWRR